MSAPARDTMLSHAGLRRRVVANTVDWSAWAAVLYAFSTVLVQVRGSSEHESLVQLSVPAVMLATLAYLTLAWWRGRSAGMLLASLRLVAVRDSGRPSGLRAFARALLVLLFVAAGVALLSLGFSDPPIEGYSTGERAVAGVVAAVFLVQLAGYLRAFIDPHGRTLQDRLLGVAVVLA